ncbi:P-loop containing nucleoside triphosphate hydrolase protein [Phycomyces blakesleeanus]
MGRDGETVLISFAGNNKLDQLTSSIKRFEDLNLREDILTGVYEMKYSAPSKIQERALPLLLEDPPRNMIGQSQSGTGKTAAFVLTILQRVDPSLPVTQAICLAPTRELARQIIDVVGTMSKFTSITSTCVIKNFDFKEKISSHVVVGTPGSILYAIRSRHLGTRNIKVFVLDEADNMLEQNGLGDQSLRIKRAIVKNPQIILFSATYATRVEKFASQFAPDAVKLTLKKSELTVEGIKQFYMDCPSANSKYDALCNFYDLLTVSQSIIFCKANEIARRMTENGHTVVSLHGGMCSEERDLIMDGFRYGEFKVLITTNVLSRGIDILQVSLVINYDMPELPEGGVDVEAYLHRVGRTGRFGRTGVSLNFVHDKDSWDKMNFVEKYFNRPIHRLSIDDLQETERIINTDAEDSEDEPVTETTEEGLLDDYPDDTTEVDAIHMRVADIPSLGLERFQNLQRLCLRQNFIIDVKGLEGLKELKELDLYDNKISRISGVNSLQTLESLDLSFNKIKHIKHIENLVNLKDLYFVSNKISKIENLDTLVNVTNLELGANRIREIQNLDHLVNLEQLWLGKNKITKLENLGALRNLRVLSIQSNRLTKLTGLEGLVNLEELYTSHNAIEKIEGLENNHKLTILDVASNKLTHIENLSHLKNLEDFWANGNQFGNECFAELERELGNIKTLQTVYLEGNPMQLENMATYRNKVRLSLPNIQRIDAT